MRNFDLAQFRLLFSLRTLFPFQSNIRGGSTLLFGAWLVFIFTILSGALRKWVLGPSTLGNSIFLFQLLMYIVFAVFVSMSKAANRFYLPVAFVIFLIYLLIASINPKNGTLYHGLFGFIIHSGLWIGLVFYYKKRHYFEIEKLIGFLILILILEVTLASIQYVLPPDHVLNVKANGLPIDATVGTAVRTSGTFSYIGGFQVLIPLYGFLIWFMVVLEYNFLWMALILILSTYASMINGSRGSLVLLFFISGYSLLYTGFLFRRTFNVFFVVVSFSILVYFFGENVIKSFSDAYSNFSERIEDGIESGETEGRILEPFKDVVKPKTEYFIYGIGLGSTYQGANTLFGESYFAKKTGGYEGELGRIIIEGGYILILFRVILMMILLRYSYIPIQGKIVVFLFFMFATVVFNNYQGIFFLYGFMLVDRAYLLKSGILLKQ